MTFFTVYPLNYIYLWVLPIPKLSLSPKLDLPLRSTYPQAEPVPRTRSASEFYLYTQAKSIPQPSFA